MVEIRKEHRVNSMELSIEPLELRTGAYRFSEFELDLSLYELRRAGEPCPLEPQVFDVLAYLVRRHDRLVSKEELLDAIWGHRYVTEASLSSRIMAARKALGDTGQQQRFIRTIRGRGYRFVAAVSERAGEAASVIAPAQIASPAASLLDARPSPVTEQPRAAVDGADADGRARVSSEPELERLGQALAGSRRVVFVTAEPGLGKTALIEALLAELRQSAGAWMAWGPWNDAGPQRRESTLHPPRVRGTGHTRAGEPGERRTGASGARGRARRRRAGGAARTGCDP